MDLAVAFAVFAAAMAGALSWGANMLWGLFAGMLAFIGVGLRRGVPLSGLLRMSWHGALGSLVVIRVFVLIGLLTAMWRTGGTFALLVAWGIKLITPSLFILVAFLLSCLLSYAIGTSFGVASTLGVVLMALARSGGVNEYIAAGAVMSGIYFGDRGSPASSCANLVAAVTSTQLFGNVKLMMKSALLPAGLSAGLYLFLSLRNPVVGVSGSTLAALEADFNLSPWAVAPAVLMIFLPVLKVRVLYAFIASILSAFLCAVLFQGRGVAETLRCCVFGFQLRGGAVGTLLDGGGLLSMLNISLILLVSSTYSSIFDGTGMLDGLQSRIERFMRRAGAFPAMALAGVLANALFCNQTIGVMMSAQIMSRPYEKAGASREELALDIANSTVTLAGMIPWCIACSMPLLMMNVSLGALPYSFYLYLLPLCYFFTKKRWFRARGTGK